MQCGSLISVPEAEHEWGSDSDSDLGPAGAPDHPDYYGRGWQAGAAAGYCAGRPAGQEPAAQGTWTGSPAVPLLEDSGPAVPVQESTHPVAPVRGCFKPVPVRFTQLEHPHAPARGSEGHNKPLTQGTSPSTCEDAHTRCPDHRASPAQQKQQGVALFRQGNYRGALRCFSLALEAGADAAAAQACLANRAACQLKLGAWADCVADCSEALAQLELELGSSGSGTAGGNGSSTERSGGGMKGSMHTPAEQREQEGGKEEEQQPPAREAGVAALQRAKLLVRRGQALAQLGELQAALADHQAALELQPGSTAIERDIVQLRAALCSSREDGRVEELLQHAAALYACQDPSGAARLYQQAAGATTATPQQRQQALSNLAACLLAAHKFEAAVAACDSAMCLLRQLGGGCQRGPDAQSAAGGAPRVAEGTQVQEPAADAGGVPAAENRSSNIGAVPTASQRAEPTKPAAGYSRALAKLLCRRGAAHAHCWRFAAACRDFQEAAELYLGAGEAERAQQVLRDLEDLRRRAS